MINAVNLIFLQHTLDLSVQGLRGIQIVAKRLFDHNATPATILLDRQPSFSQLLNDVRKKLGRSRQVKKIIALGVALKVHGLEPLPEFQKCVRVPKIAALVKEPLPKPLQVVSSVISGGQESSDLVPKFLDLQVVD